MEYAIYPIKNIGISQRHDEGNHIPHWQPEGQVDCDKPWDEASFNSGRSAFCSPNEYKIVDIIGLDPSVWDNTVRLESTQPLKIPYQDEPVILEITLTHINEDNLRQLSVGQIIHPYEEVIYEGNDGYSTGNHFHITVNIGNYYGCIQNANGAWCFVYDKSLTPTEAFYLDPNFNVIYDTRGYEFKDIPKTSVGNPVDRNTKVNQINVKIDDLNARIEPSTSANRLGYMNMGYYDVEEMRDNEGYIWFKVQNMWVAYNEDWEDYLPKEEKKTEEIQREYMNRILENMPQWLESVIEK